MTDRRTTADGLERRTVLKTIAATGLTASAVGRVAGSAVDDSYPTVEFQKTYGSDGDDSFNAIRSVTDGGYVLAGQRGPEGNPWLARVDDAGTVTWERTYGPDSRPGTLADVVEVGDGFVAAGTLRSSSASGPSNGFVVMVDDAGEVRWTHRNDSDTTQYGGLLADGSDLIVGGAGSTSTPGESMALKLDGGGTVQWERTYDESFIVGRPVSAVPDSTGIAYVLPGSTGLPILGDGTGVLIGVDAEGTEQWRRTVSGDGSAFFVRGVPISADGSEGYLVSGGTSAGPRDFPSPFLAWFDAAGAVTATKAPGSEEGFLYGLAELSPDRYLTTGAKGVGFGSSSSKALVAEVGADGSVLERGTVGGEGSQFFLDVDASGVAAGQKTPGTSDDADAWLVGFETAGGSGGGIAERSLGSSSAFAGGSLSVTLTAEFDSDQDAVSILDEFSGPLDSGSIDSIAVDGSELADSKVTFSDADAGGITVAVEDVPAGTLAVTYSVSVADDASTGATIEFTGNTDEPDVSAGDTTAEFGTDTATVAESAVDAADTDGDGDIDDGELRSAIVDWSGGRFSDSALRDIIVEWSS